jgi:anti-sigma regulatory factor (Ser/Thr protein kinase)
VNGQRVSARPDHREAAAEPAVPAGHAGTCPADDVLRAELPADLTSARQARAAVRQALAAWGMSDPSGDAELLASELVANASEHGGGPVSLALRRQAAQDGQPGIACEVTDTGPAPATPGQARRRARPRARDRRGPGQLHRHSATDTGKTTWFTLALRDRAARVIRQADAEAEAGA